MKKIYFVLSLLFSFSATTFAQTLHTVNSGSYYYTPSNFTINVGDTVTWLNDGGLHNVNFDISVITGNSFGNPESFASSPTTGPVLYTHVFTIPGSYSYDCSVGAHAQNGMVGSLTVNGPPPNSVYDVVSNSVDHTTLEAAVNACGLDVALSGAGPFTLFAPTDAAFNALPSGTVPALLNDIPTLTNILLHHVVGDSVMSGMLSNGQIVTTLAGTDLTVTIDTSGVYIDGAQVIVADVVADNGVVHVIDAVLLPPTPDCNGIVGGTSILDSCGICQQAYIYNFSTNIPTFLNDTAGVIVGPGEALIMPDDPSNPLWNASCSGCTDPLALNYDSTATIDNGTCIYSTNSVYNIVSNSVDHTTLKVAIDACSLDGTLSAAGPFTLFAPTDAAFNALPQGTVTALLNDLPLLTNILLHHVVGDSVMSGMLSNGQVVTTLLGTDLTVSIDTSGVYIDGAQVTVADVIADNGVVHVIDAVLLPNPGCTDPTATNYDANAIVDDGSCTYATNTVYDIVVTSTDHNLLELAIDTCSLDGTLSGAGPFTLFAPTDAAFNALPSGTVAALLNDLPLLTNILLHHVVGDSVMSGMLSNGQVVTTLLGTDVTVTINTSGVFIDNAQVTVADVIADNGVVHVIDAVLLPNPGCTDPTATNYDANAIVDDGSCTYATNTVYDVVVTSPDHTLLEIGIDTCGFDAYLSGPGPFTLFAPTDAAFNALPPVTLLALLNDIPQLTNILKHHVVGDSVMSGMLSNGQVITTLLGTDVTVTINSSGVYIDNAMVTVVDIVADNGVVHVIDAVLLPPAPSNTIYDIISKSSDHTVLSLAIDTCGLAGTLKGAGPFTVFAPTDAAFNALPQGTIAALLNDLPQLTDILLHHVVGDSVMSGMLSNAQVVTTLLGDDVTVTINSMGVYIDNAQVTVADIVADNGVVHVIDAVLLPSTVGINDNDNVNNYEYLYSVNLLGEKVNRSKRNQVVLDIYSNGKVVKRFNP